jgi:hypothetical protein
MAFPCPLKAAREKPACAPLLHAALHMATRCTRPQDIRSFEGYSAPLYKKLFIFYPLGVLSCGLLLLAAKWSPRLRAWLTLSRCHLKDAQYVRVTVRGNGNGQQPG